MPQQAWLHLGTLDAGATLTYQPKQVGNGVYAFVLAGEVFVNGQPLSRHDGLGSWDTDALHLETSSKATVLLLDAPLPS